MRTFTLALLLVSLVGCSSTPTVSPVSPTQPLTGVQAVAVEGAGLMYAQTTLTLRAVATFGDGQQMAAEKASWTTSAPLVAQVDSRGTVTGLSAGVATIVGSIGGQSGSLSIRVVPDYRGTWTGEGVRTSCRGHYCGPRYWPYPYPYVPPPLPIVLLIEQDGASLVGRVVFNNDLGDNSGSVSGHVETDGTMVIDRGPIDKWGYQDLPRIVGWRTSAQPDENTMTGSYTSSLGIDTLEATYQITIRRVPPQ